MIDMVCWLPIVRLSESAAVVGAATKPCQDAARQQ